MLSVLISLLIICLILGVAWWIMSVLPLPPPFPLILQVIIVVIALILLINLLLGVAPGALHPLLR